MGRYPWKVMDTSRLRLMHETELPSYKGMYFEHALRSVQLGETILRLSNEEVTEAVVVDKGTTRQYPVMTCNKSKAITAGEILNQLPCVDENTNQEKENSMSQVTRNQTLYLMDGIGSLNVQYEEGETVYTYLFREDETYMQGDVVIVPKASGNGYQSAIVHSVDDTPNIDENARFEYKFVIGRLDLAKHQATLNAIDAATKQYAAAKHNAKRKAYQNAIREQSGVSLNLLESLAE